MSRADGATDDADPAEIAGGHAGGHAGGVLTACKLYPTHATTNSAHGVTDIRKRRAVLETLQRIGMPLLIHGEVTGRDIDILDREASSSTGCWPPAAGPSSAQGCARTHHHAAV